MDNKISKKASGFSLSALSSARGYIMGIATVMVVIFHSYIKFEKLMPNALWLAEILDTIRRACVSGVDIFLFVSGIGLYYSLSNNKSLKEFYKKRATRILPAVILVAVYWFGTRGSDGIAEFLKNVTLVSFYTDGVRYFWYFALIIFLYAIYPLIHLLLEKTKGIGAVVLVGVTILITFLYKVIDYQQFLYIEIALSRIPVFIIGAYMGRLVKEGKRIPYGVVWAAAILIIPATIIGYNLCPQWIADKVANYGTLIWIQRAMGNILGICLSLVCAALMGNKKMGCSGTFLLWIGVYSMEIYLVHEKLGILMYNKISTGDNSHIAFYGIIFVLSIPVALALKAFTDSLNKNLFYKNKPAKKQ